MKHPKQNHVYFLHIDGKLFSRPIHQQKLTKLLQKTHRRQQNYVANHTQHAYGRASNFGSIHQKIHIVSVNLNCPFKQLHPLIHNYPLTSVFLINELKA